MLAGTAAAFIALAVAATPPPPIPTDSLFAVAWRKTLVQPYLLEYKPFEPAGPGIDPLTGMVVVATRDGYVQAFSAEGKDSLVRTTGGAVPRATDGRRRARHHRRSRRQGLRLRLRPWRVPLDVSLSRGVRKPAGDCGRPRLPGHAGGNGPRARCAHRRLDVALPAGAVGQVRHPGRGASVGRRRGALPGVRGRHGRGPRRQDRRREVGQEGGSRTFPGHHRRRAGREGPRLRGQLRRTGGGPRPEERVADLGGPGARSLQVAGSTGTSSWP